MSDRSGGHQPREDVQPHEPDDGRVHCQHDVDQPPAVDVGELLLQGLVDEVLDQHLVQVGQERSLTNVHQGHRPPPPMLRLGYTVQPSENSPIDGLLLEAPRVEHLHRPVLRLGNATKPGARCFSEPQKRVE